MAGLVRDGPTEIGCRPRYAGGDQGIDGGNEAEKMRSERDAEIFRWSSNSMTDPYPSSLSIEIDRDRLTKYYRLQAKLVWLTLFGFLTLFAVGIAIRSAADAVEDLQRARLKLAPEIRSAAARRI